MQVTLKKTKYRIIAITHDRGRGHKDIHKNASHSYHGGMHIITVNDQVFYYPYTDSIVICTEPLVQDTSTNDQPVQASYLDDLADAGNELHRLVCETRDSIYDSNVICGTNEFPDNEEGLAGEAWWKEYADAAQAWNEAANKAIFRES